MTGEASSIRRLVPSQAPAYRALMLRAYTDPSAAFTATVVEREALPLAWWESRLHDRPDASEMVFGAFQQERLAGVAGLRLQQRPRTRHKASLYGMAVEPAYRRRGIGRALVEAALRQAASIPVIRLVQLTVSEPNTAAVSLYRSCGFAPFGTEPEAIRFGDAYVSLLHMWRPAREPAPGAFRPEGSP